MLIALVIIGLYYYGIFNLQLSHVVEITVDTTSEKPNKCIFGVFIELFKVTNSSYVYYPSYFIPNNIIYDQNFEEQGLSVLEHVLHEQYVKLNDLTCITYEHIESLRGILKEYSDILTNI
jgi:hypothetical protein